MKSRGPYVLTFSGKKFYPKSPDPDDVCIQDIAMALARQCRFNGHCDRFLSVAEHCCIVHDLLKFQNGDQVLLFEGLLHDAGEAYISDVPKPIKDALPGYREMEDSIFSAVMRRFGLPDHKRRQEVKAADWTAFLYEVRQNRRAIQQDMWTFAIPQEAHIPMPLFLTYWSPDMAYREFMSRFAELYPPNSWTPDPQRRTYAV